jgi:hypothetical protein
MRLTDETEGRAGEATEAGRGEQGKGGVGALESEDLALVDKGGHEKGRGREIAVLERDEAHN